MKNLNSGIAAVAISALVYGGYRSVRAPERSEGEARENLSRGSDLPQVAVKNSITEVLCTDFPVTEVDRDGTPDRGEMNDAFASGVPLVYRGPYPKQKIQNERTLRTYVEFSQIPIAAPASYSHGYAAYTDYSSRPPQAMVVVCSQAGIPKEEVLCPKLVTSMATLCFDTLVDYCWTDQDESLIRGLRVKVAGHELNYNIGKHSAMVSSPEDKEGYLEEEFELPESWEMDDLTTAVCQSSAEFAAALESPVTQAAVDYDRGRSTRVGRPTRSKTPDYRKGLVWYEASNRDGGSTDEFNIEFSQKNGEIHATTDCQKWAFMAATSKEAAHAKQTSSNEQTFIIQKTDSGSWNFTKLSAAQNKCLDDKESESR